MRYCPHHSDRNEMGEKLAMTSLKGQGGQTFYRHFQSKSTLGLLCNNQSCQVCVITNLTNASP